MQRGKKTTQWRQCWFQALTSADWLILVACWLLSLLVDRLWFGLDHSVPAWDQADHLNRALANLRVLQQANLLSGEWWRELWLQSSSYRGPVVYLLTAPFLQVFGLGYAQAALVNTFFSGLLMSGLYGLGRLLANRQIGLWAAGLSLLAPVLAFQRTDYLLDLGIAALLTGTYALLTAWHFSLDVGSQFGSGTARRWGLVVPLGLGLGLTVMVKPTTILFLAIPLLWQLGSSLALLWQCFLKQCLRPKRAGSGWQHYLIGDLLPSGLTILLGYWVCWPWLSTNWLTIITSSLTANQVGRREGDPPPLSLDSWLHYWVRLPELISTPLFMSVCGAGLLLVWYGWRGKRWTIPLVMPAKTSVAWLAAFLVPGYLICTLATNKDNRFILPLIPVGLLLLAWLLVRLPGVWGRRYRWLTAALTGLTLLVHLFPVPGLAGLPGLHRVYLGPRWPHPEVVAKVAQVAPYLRSTIGLTFSTTVFNQQNLSFYGALAGRRVYGREAGKEAERRSQDLQSLDWFLSQAPLPENTDPAMVNLIQQTSGFERYTWPLLDQIQLILHHRRQERIQVRPAPDSDASAAPSPESPSPLIYGSGSILLHSVRLPAQAPAGQILPITYTWLGPWQQLQNGLVLLEWQPLDPAADSPAPVTWQHDHAFGLGRLFPSPQISDPQQPFIVQEQLATFPPTHLPPGRYRLQGQYLNRETGQTAPLALPVTTIQITAPFTVGTSSPPLDSSAPPLDLVSQFQHTIPSLRQGNLNPIGALIGYAFRYDPRLDYLDQVISAAQARLQQTPQDLNLRYGLGLAQALQTDPAMLTTFAQISQQDRQNPYAWIYLGVVNLYWGQSQAAEQALNHAAQLPGHPLELRFLQTAAALLQGQLPRAWHYFYAVEPSQPQSPSPRLSPP